MSGTGGILPFWKAGFSPDKIGKSCSGMQPA